MEHDDGQQIHAQEHDDGQQIQAEADLILTCQRQTMKKVIVVVGVLVSIASCKKADNGNITPPPPPVTGNVLSLNTHIVDSVAIKNVSDASVTLLKSKTTQEPKAGDILIAAPTGSNPFGFLRKVTSISDNGNEILCSTVQSNLNDAFAQLNFSITYLDTFSSNASFDVMQTGSRLSVKLQNNNILANGINLNGELFFNIPSVKIEYAKKAGTTSPQKVLIQAEFNTDGSRLQVTNNSIYAREAGEKQITVFDLPDIRVPVSITTSGGARNISLPFSQKLIIKMLPLSVSGKGKWIVVPKCSAVLGLQFENSIWTNLSTYSIDASADSLIKNDFASSPNMTANLTIVKPEFEVSPYATKNLETLFEIPNSMDLTLQSASPNYSLKYAMDVKGGTNQEFYTGVNQVYNITGNSINKTLKEGDWPLENSFIDPRDGKSYTYRQFGTQEWMTQNLNFNALCYSNNPANCNYYGGLYTVWAPPDPPTGWHLPSDAEWQVLINYMKVNPQAWNDFAVRPGGRLVNDLQDLYQFIEIGESGWWWTSTSYSWPGPNDNYYNRCYQYHNGQDSLTSTFLPKTYALSIRCVKDK